LGIIDGGEMPINVRLLFEPKLAGYITERQSHPSQAFHVRRDGCSQMRFKLNNQTLRHHRLCIAFDLSPATAGSEGYEH